MGRGTSTNQPPSELVGDLDDEKSGAPGAWGEIPSTGLHHPFKATVSFHRLWGSLNQAKTIKFGEGNFCENKHMYMIICVYKDAVLAIRLFTHLFWLFLEKVDLVHLLEVA